MPILVRPQSYEPAVLSVETDLGQGLDDGFDKQMEEFFDYILDAKAFEDMETYVNGGPGPASTGFEESPSDK